MKFRDILKRLSRPISLEHLTDYEVYDDGDRFRTGKVILPTGQVDTRTGRLAINQDVQVIEHTPSDNSIPTITIPDGEIWLVLQIHGEWQMDATVADRTFRLKVHPHHRITMSNISLMWRSDVATLSASQEGQIVCTTWGNNNHFTNDNDTAPGRDLGNICSAYMQGGAYIEAALGNVQTGDRGSLEVYYQKVGTV